MSGLDNLPSGWSVISFESATIVEKGRKPRSLGGRNAQRSLPYVNIKAFERGVIEEFCDPKEAIVQCAQGDTLIVWDGARAGLVGKAPTGAVGSTLAKLSSPVLESDYLRLFLSSKYRELNARTKGVGIPHLDPQVLGDLSIPVAPEREQRRIVEAIETRFARLDAAVRALERARANLKQYRASVLEAACSGRLVRTDSSLARENGTSFEPATALVARLSEERQRAGAELGSRRDLINVSEVALPSEPLPEGWRWYPWAELAGRVTVGYVGPISNQHSEVGVPLVRSQNVRPNRFEPKGMSHVPREFYLVNRKCGVSGGDICVVRSGDVGVACVIPNGLGEALCSDLVIIQRPVCVVPQYGSYVMNSVVRQRVLRGKVGIGLSHYNTKSVAALPIPVPPMAEQERIVEEVERRLSVVDAASLEVERALFRCVRLRNSVLKSAFEGRLIPQDPNDEPASALLERIKRVCQTTPAPPHRVRKARVST